MGNMIGKLLSSTSLSIYLLALFRSLSAFQKVLYLAPDFARLSEVHIRMGLMYKNKGDFKKSMEVLDITLRLN